MLTDAAILEIQTAQHFTRVAIAARDALVAQLNEEMPEPGLDTDDDTWDAWNITYETARMERGGFRLDDAAAARTDDLLMLCQGHLATLFPTMAASVRPVFDAAMGVGRRGINFAARDRALDLCLRWDPEA